jgi:hypothetical protein
VTQRLVALDVGARPQARAPRVVPHVAQGWAPAGAPLCVTDGGRADAPAWLPHEGGWGQAPRRPAPGPGPTPRGRPLPPGREAQGVKTPRRRRGVDVTHRVVCGTSEAVKPVLGPLGGQSKPALVERFPLSRRQPGAAMGRRVQTRCQGEAGWRPQWVLSQVDAHVVVPHARWRQPLAEPLATHGQGAAQVWQPWTPAMAAGLTAHVWSRREVLRCRVPPWPQPPTVEEPAPLDARGRERLRGAQMSANGVG